MSEPSNCSGDAPHPRTLANPPGLDAVAYRNGDFSSYRGALLVPRPGEKALAGWHPVAGTDLALQLVEWWAYLADVLAFYNERAMQEVLLRTAAHPEDIRRIVRLLGYRPRPGIGATGVVAALTDAADPFVVPRGFAIEGGTAPDQPPQIFEVDDDVEMGRLGRPLPKSARFPKFRPAGPSESSSGETTVTAEPSAPPVARDDKGRLRNSADANEATDDGPAPKAGETFPIFFDGVVASLQPDDMLLIVRRDWIGPMLPGTYAVTSVRSIEARFDTAEPPYTGLQLLTAFDLPAPISQCRILRPTKLAHLWLYHQRYPGSADPSRIGASIALQVVKTLFLGLFASGGIPTQPPEDPRVLTGFTAMGVPPPHGVAHLEAITRGIAAGDLVLFEKRVGGGILGMFEKLVAGGFPSGPLAILRMLVMQCVRVNGYAEDIWYGNAPEWDRVGMGPPVGPPDRNLITGGQGPIPIPHSRITFDINPFLDMMAMGDLDLDKIVVHYGWEEVGERIPPPTRTGPVGAVAVGTLDDVQTATPVPVIVTDQNGKGEYGWLGQTTSTGGGTTRPGGPLVPPLQALLNLLPVSRGESVRGEVLGSGDPTRVWQEFTLKRSPLTYLADTGPHATNGYRSTLRIRVDGIEWREVPSFYGQPRDARVFVTREDDANKTHVRFGDGENGARLPARTANVVADYRVGSGASIPPAGTLTSILRPQPGLASIVDAIPVGGGSDPDPPEQLRRYAPRSVLTFGRAISGDDYEVVAAQTPGVRHARVYWSWDPGSQRTVVKVFVGDDDAAVAAVREALTAFGDPNRPATVALAAPVFPDVTLRVQVDPAYVADDVRAAVARFLLDPQRLPFGAGVIRIGEPIYDSEIYDACLSVPGVVAVHGLRFGTWTQVPSGGGGGGAAPPASMTLGGDAGLLGPSFILDDVFDPLGLAIRIGTTEETLFDPFALAVHLEERLRGGVPAEPAPSGPGQAGPAFDEFVRIESTERHSPGEGRFYLLREERLHITAEAARHVL